MAAEFKTPITSTVQMPIDVTEDGNIATGDDIAAAIKNVSIAGIKSSATLAETNAVFDTFYGTIAGGSYDSLSAKKTTTQTVEE